MNNDGPNGRPAVATGRKRVEVPGELMAKWQTIVDTMAELVEVPAGLIMCLNNDAIEVCVSSRTAGNPYHVGESDVWEGSGLYCETVIKGRRRLLVPDARTDVAWCRNPDVAREMVSYLGFPIRWPDGRPFGTICVLDSRSNAYSYRHEKLIEQFRDIIEHHLGFIARDFDRQLAAEGDRAWHAAALALSQQRLREAQAELARASRLSEIGHFAGTVVHEVNQPLAAVAMSAAACLRWLERDEPDLPEACATLRRLMAASRRAADVIAVLRSLARKAPPAMKEFDLRDLILETVAMLRGELDEAQVAEDLVFDDAELWAVGDRIQVQLVLHNLMRNAIESMADVPDRRRRLTIRVEGAADASTLTVSVVDNGAGLEPSVAKRVLNSPFTTKATGMGVGLTICRSIVEAHGGVITALSEPNLQGARFAFSLPACRPATADGLASNARSACTPAEASHRRAQD